MNFWSKSFSDPNAFIECSNTMDGVYENIDDYHASRKRKILIVLDDMIADIMTNKKFQAIIKAIFVRYRKVNISLVLSVLFFCPKQYYIKFNTLFDYENKKQKRITRYCN